MVCIGFSFFLVVRSFPSARLKLRAWLLHMTLSRFLGSILGIVTCVQPRGNTDRTKYETTT